MRKISILLLTLAAAWSLDSCTREIIEQTAGSGDVLIRLQVDALQTKTAGTTDENYVESLQVLVFKDIASAPAKYFNLTSEITPGEITYEKEFATLDAFGGFTAEELTNATVFAVANYSGDLSSVTSLAAAKAQAVNADGFLTSSPDGMIVKTAPRFIMTAEGSFARETGTNRAVADLTLTRLAAKISLVLTYAKTDPTDPITTKDAVSGATTVWTPMAEGNVRVYLSNAANNGKLDGTPADTPVLFTYADDNPEGETTLTSSAFYTYPVTWDEGSEDAPFLKIIQPWSYKTIINEGTEANPKPVVIDQNVVELYYKVVFPGLTALERNTWYQPTVTLNVLGGESTRNMTELTPSGFDILPWGTVGSGAGEGLSPIAIDPAKYVALEREHTIINNGGGVSIKYVASGPTTLTVVKIHKMVFGNTEDMIERKIYPDKDALVDDDYAGDGGTGSIASGSSDAWFENSYGTDPQKPNEGAVILRHELSTDFSDDNFAARPYEYRLRLHLTSEGADTSLDQEFTITQNPALLADGQLSTGWVCINGQDAINASASAGNTHTSVSGLYTNGYQPRSSSAYTAPYVRLAGTLDDDVYHAYISTKAKLSGYNATMQAVNNLGTIHTYNYLAPSGANSSQWRILIRPTSKSGVYIMDPRIDISSDTGHELYKLLHTHTRNFGNNTAASTFLDGTPLFADGSPSSTYTSFKKYTPTGNTDEYRSALAPEIMFASSYGKSTNINYFVSLLRCAAYQEDGYPAGRWRLPTEEEIEIAISLNQVGAIPTLFTTAGWYWASSGRYIKYDGSSWGWHDPDNAERTFPTNSSDDRYKYLGARCVYDTWYWGKEEVDALKTSDYQSDYTKPQYIWSGYDYTTK